MALARSPAEALALLRSPFVHEDVVGQPLMVDLTGPSARADPPEDLTEDDLALLHSLPTVTVAVHAPGEAVGCTRWAQACDVAVEDALGVRGAAARRMASAIEAHPQAGMVLAQLLRSGPWTGAAALTAGLWAESLAYSTLQAGAEFAAWLAARPPPAAVGFPVPDASPAVLVERRGRSARVQLNRPEVHNALGIGLRDALVEVLRALYAEPTVEEIVLCGAGASFCSGGDLREFGTLPDPASAHVVRATRSPAAWMAALGPRLVAEVHGVCVGAGVELAAFAGRVVASPDARFWLPEVAMGLVPGAGGTVSLPRRIGRQRTARLALGGEAIDATTALAWGLVDEVR